MKRSLLDPLPRQLSTKALAALVALVVCGTGVAVMRFLESGPGAPPRAPSAVRAASPSDEPAPQHAPRAPRTARPDGRTAGPSWTGPSSSLGDTGRCNPATTSSAAPVRDSEPTLFEPERTGS